MLKSRVVGGAAAAGGFSFQDSVAAWAAVDLLAEQAATLRWGLDPSVSYCEIRCETGLPVDDLMIITSSGGAVYVQAKRGVKLSSGADSQLGSAVDQFVRHFLSQRSHGPGQHPWERPLDEDRDRLVLVTDGNAPKWATLHLPALLDRFRRDPVWTDLTDAAKNKDENYAAKMILSHAKSSWRRSVGKVPTATDLRELLSLVRIDSLDARPDGVPGRDDLTAMDKLRQAVLVVPNQAETAYGLLKLHCRTLAANHGRTDRGDLQRVLLRNRVDVRPALGLAPDLALLRRRTDATLRQAEELSVIEMEGRQVKIDRPAVRALIDAVEKERGNCLVIGTPGAGKSGVLHNAVKIMLNRGWDVVFLAADVLGANSIGELRNDLGTHGDLVNLIEQWDRNLPGVLVIDGLDAARADRAARVLRALMGQVLRLNGRWRVVGSIREFDLRCSGDWQDLFRGPPPAPEYSHPDFPNVRHLRVPLLGESELAQVAEQSQELGSLISMTKGQPLYDLLCQPFNLRLGAALLSDGLSTEELSPLLTQIELLDRYWDRRVLGHDAEQFQREAFVRGLCERMVEQQSLRISTRSVEMAQNATPLHQLLRQGVLSQFASATSLRTHGDWLAFSHHVLFDYAVARTLLRGSANAFVDRLTDSPESVLVIRPSLSLHFEYLWLDDPTRSEFWSTARALLRSAEIPTIGKLVASEVATESANSLADLQPLLDALRAPGPDERESVGIMIAHVVGSLLASRKDFADEKNLIWYQWAEQVSAPTSHAVVSPLASLLGHWLPLIARMADPQKRLIGAIAGRLILFAEANSRARRRVYPVAIAAACRTLASGPDEGRRGVEMLLRPGSLNADKVDALLRISMEVKSLVVTEPKLVEQVYGAVFQAEEVQDERVPMGQSRILSMTVSLRDQFKIAEWNLAEAFSNFLERDSASALRSLGVALECYIRRERYYVEGGHKSSLSFRGRLARFAEDGSCIWDEGSVRQGEAAIRMVSALEAYTAQTAVQTPADLAGLLDSIAATQSRAVVWRRLLRAGAKQPGALGSQLLPLLEADPILLSHDTTTEAGQLLNRIFPLLETEDRLGVEEAILRLPQSGWNGSAEVDRRERTRDRLLGCLPVEMVGTDEAKRLLRQMQEMNGVPPNEPAYRMTFERTEVSERESWEQSGISYESAEAGEYRRLVAPVKDFVANYRNDETPSASVEEVFPALQEVANFVLNLPPSQMGGGLITMALDQLAECIEIIRRTDYLVDNEDFVAMARTVLLRASEDERPTATSESTTQFDQFPSWGSPAPRIVAARGLLLMARDRRTYSPEVCEAIQRLAHDPVPAVRYMVANFLGNLGRVEPELMWRLIGEFARNEPSSAVLFALVSDTVERLLGSDTADRIIEITDLILGRVPVASRSIDHDPRKRCLAVLLRIYLYLDDLHCREVLFEIAQTPGNHVDELVYLCAYIRSVLDERSRRDANDGAVAAAGRAWAWMNEVCLQATRSLQRLRGQLQASPDSEDAPAVEAYEEVARLVDSATMDIYFASGAHDVARGSRTATNLPTDDYRRRFFERAKPTLEHLADAGLARVSHYLIETLRFLIDVDPAEVFVLVGEVVRKSMVDAYHHESLAADLIVGVVERYLADYRDVFLDNQECQQVLIELLDTFVGWPEARRLAYRLGEVFR
jgi:hypothetical protein